MIKDPLNDNLVAFDVRTLAKLSAMGASHLALFVFLAKSAKIQNTSKVWANRKFICKGLKIGTNKYQEVLAELEKEGMIERSKQGSGKDGKRQKNYIKLNYCMLSRCPTQDSGGEEGEPKDTSPLVKALSSVVSHKTTENVKSIKSLIEAVLTVVSLPSTDSETTKCLLKKVNAFQVYAGQDIKKQFGNEKINKLFAFIKERTGLPVTAGGQSRQFASNFLKNLKKEYPKEDESLLAAKVVELATNLNDNWHSTKAHDPKHLFYNWQEIIKKSKGNVITKF